MDPLPRIRCPGSASAGREQMLICLSYEQDSRGQDSRMPTMPPVLTGTDLDGAVAGVRSLIVRNPAGPGIGVRRGSDKGEL